MEFSDIKEKLENCTNKPFSELFEGFDLVDVIENKGKSGQLLEKILGIENGNSNVDLDDMEIKSFKVGQTIAITQISSHIEDIVNQIPFEDSWIYEKIKTVLFNEVDKSSPNPENWKYLTYKIVSLDENKKLFERLKVEFNSICIKIRDSIANGGFIHTTNGSRSAGSSYIQIRTKDSTPYHPIYFSGVPVSEKNYAFYFTNNFVKEVILETTV